MGGDDTSKLFPELRLSDSLVESLRRMNPWWEGRPMRLLPTTRRHLVAQMRLRLHRKLAPVVLVRGPRQIGKTTAQEQLIADLLNEGVEPQRILRFQADELPAIRRIDEPMLRVVGWFEGAILRHTLNQAAHANRPAYLFFDEVQNLPDWAAQLKHLVDGSDAQVVVTGSSALRLEMGRDSLAGRISTIEAGVLSLTEVAAFHQVDLGSPRLADNGLDPMLKPDFWKSLREEGRRCAESRNLAFACFSDRGGYPLAHERAEIEWAVIADQLNENVIRRVIQHDLRVGERGRRRDAALLEEVFRMACRYVGQCPGAATIAREAQRTFAANVGPNRISQYLRFLDNTLLIRAIKPLEIRLRRKRGHDKLCLADHGLRAGWLQEVVPIDPPRLAAEPHLADLAGRIAESVVGVTLASIHQLDVAHLPAREDDPEVDFVVTIGTRRIPVEVKYRRRIDPLADTEGLRTFLENAAYNAPLGLLISLTDDVAIPDPRIVALPLSSFMLLR
jgi:predicted AAA+ superfamily ATPase